MFHFRSNSIRHCPSEPALHRGSPSPTPSSQHLSRSGSISGPGRGPQSSASSRTEYYSNSGDLLPPQRSEPVFRKPLLPYNNSKQDEPPTHVSPRASRAGPIRAMAPSSPDPEEALMRMSISEKKHSSLEYVPMLTDKPSGLDMEDFLPVSETFLICFLLIL
jgi:hypothetical protein